VLVIDSAQFPRDKACGDGLTPRAVLELQRLGLGSWLEGRVQHRGLRLLGFGGDVEVEWPGPSFPTVSSAVPRTELEEELTFMQPNATVQVLAVNGKPSSVQLPASVELAVVETEPGVKGDTVSNVTKPATLETGAVVQVPLFVNVGDRLKVDPKEKRYISRV